MTTVREQLADQAQQTANLERQLAELRSDFMQNWTVARFLHEIGYEQGRASILGRPDPDPDKRKRARPSHLRSVGNDTA
jgi:hypothetical protein